MYSKSVAVDRLERVEAGLRRHVGRPQLTKDALVHAAQPHPVGAHQRVDRHALLRQPSRVFEGCGRRFDTLDRDAVAQCVQDRIDVAFDARAEQFDGPRIATQLGDVVFEGPSNERRHLRQLLMHPLGGLGDKAAHVHASVGTGVGHPMTVDPAGSDGEQFGLVRESR